MRSLRDNRGFTLIELLIVIAIIGLLASIVVISLNDSRAVARDGRRLADFEALRTALELYYEKYGAYPCGNDNAPAGYDHDGDPDTALVPVPATRSTSFGQPFLDGIPEGGTPPSECDTSAGPLYGLVRDGLVQGQILDPAQTSFGPGSGYLGHGYLYYVDEPRQQYILVTGLESDTERCENDGGRYDDAWEYGPSVGKEGSLSWVQGWEITIYPCGG